MTEIEIPDHFRPDAKACAARRIRDAISGGYFDDDRYRRIINDLAEEEWARDRIEWKAWMRQMRDAFQRKFHDSY
jgi:hypothetical protein